MRLETGLAAALYEHGMALVVHTAAHEDLVVELGQVEAHTFSEWVVLTNHVKGVVVVDMMYGDTPLVHWEDAQRDIHAAGQKHIVQLIVAVLSQADGDILAFAAELTQYGRREEVHKAVCNAHAQNAVAGAFERIQGVDCHVPISDYFLCKGEQALGVFRELNRGGRAPKKLHAQLILQTLHALADALLGDIQVSCSFCKAHAAADLNKILHVTYVQAITSGDAQYNTRPNIRQQPVTGPLPYGSGLEEGVKPFPVRAFGEVVVDKAALAGTEVF